MLRETLSCLANNEHSEKIWKELVDHDSSTTEECVIFVRFQVKMLNG